MTTAFFTVNPLADAFYGQLSTARKAADDARKALADARKHVEPISAEMHALFLTRPADYAKCLRKIADIVESLPTLEQAVTDTEVALPPLEDRVCYGPCGGTGNYAGASGIRRAGHSFCFTCGGTGQRKSK